VSQVTRIAWSKDLNPGKYAQLQEQARRLGRVRSEVWQRYGSVSGAQLGDRTVRDWWMADGTGSSFGTLANPWKETVRDAMADIRANQEAAKAKAREAIRRHTSDERERRRMYRLLKTGRWADDGYLSRIMRKYWRRGHNHTSNQIVVRSDQYTTWTLAEGRNVWLAVPGLERRSRVAIPLNTTVAPTGTLRLILRGGRAEVHYQVQASALKSAQRPCGTRQLGVDKGYTEVLTDSDGEHYGIELGQLLTAQSDLRKRTGIARSKLHAGRDRAIEAGDHAKAQRIERYNLGTAKRDRQAARWRAQVRTATYQAVNQVVDKAAVVVAEDLTRPFTGRKKLGCNTSRRLAAWTKGLTARALHDVPERRGSALVLVNAAYTSQADPRTGLLATRRGDRLYLPGGVVMQADHAAAINILHRASDPDITLHTPWTRVRQILQERADRQRARLPAQDSSPPGGERTIQICSAVSKNLGSRPQWSPLSFWSGPTSRAFRRRPRRLPRYRRSPRCTR
jgi:transposase